MDILKKLWKLISPYFENHPRTAWGMGALIIVAAGLWLFWRRRRRLRSQRNYEKLGFDSRQDHSLRDQASDQLDRGPFVESLVRALVRSSVGENDNITARKATGFVIGLTGSWGLGKSSILNMLHKELSGMSHVAVTLLNPWLFKDRDELLRAYFNGLRQALGASSDERVRALLGDLEKYRQTIDWVGKATATLVDAHGGFGGSINALWAGVSGWLAKMRAKEARSLEEERRALEEKIGLADVAIVVLIDELDRIEDAEVRAVAQLIKAVGEIRGISYLVAYDPARVADALGRGEKDDRRRSGYEYLEKIIQFPIPVRPLFERDIDALLTASLADFGLALESPTDDNRQAIYSQIKRAIKTPREVKRLVGAFSVLEEMMRGEISHYDLLAYCWILTKAPSVKDALVTNFGRIVEDPVEEAELRFRVTGSSDKPTPESILGSAAAPFDGLLKLLFPRFGEDRRDKGVINRISRRRNLERLLYMGNPPGDVRRTDIEHVWNLPDSASIEVELRRLRDTSALPAFLDRLEDLLPSLPVSGDVNFWLALTQLFYAKSDWITEADTRRSLVEDAGASLYRAGVRKNRYLARAKNILKALCEHGDLVLVPWMLRKHLFAFGLTKHGGPRGGNELLDLTETEQLLSLVVPQYRQAVLDGRALRRLPNVEAIYVLANTNNWDSELYQGLTAQLGSLEAIGSIAALLVPPGYSTERQHLQELFDVEQVRQNLESELQVRGWPQDPYVANCLRRLRRIMRGGDPNFDDDDNGNE